MVPIELEVLAEGWPTLLWCPVEVTQPTGSVDSYQLVLALHRLASPAAEPESLVGVVAAPSGTAHVYDALGDPAGSLLLARHVAPDVKVEAPEPRRRRDGRTSRVVFDDRWELTLYRRTESGPEPDVAIPLALSRWGAAAVSPPVATWHRRGWDLAALRRESAKTPDGVEVARRSLSELLSRRCPPQDCRADIWSDAERLGAAVAEVHVASADIFGVSPLDAADLAAALVRDARRGSPGRLDLAGIEASLRRLEAAVDLGSTIRVHGDLHLGNVDRDRRQWRVRGFVSQRTTGSSSPLRDVAGMLRSFREIAALAAAERATVAPRSGPVPPVAPVERTIDRELSLLADAWAERATAAFVAGYTSVDEVHRLLPEERTARDALLVVHELCMELDELKWDVLRRQATVDLTDRRVVRLVGASDSSRSHP